MIEKKIKNNIRNIPDFPKQGINFKDITPILADAQLSRQIVDEFLERFNSKKIEGILGIETRGFLFGMMMANRLDVPFIMVRKEGKLPSDKISHSYSMEYGAATLEMHEDALDKDSNVLIHDDLLATGGTASAAAELARQSDANIMGFAFVIELEFLNGRQKLTDYSDDIISLVSYKDE